MLSLACAQALQHIHCTYLAQSLFACMSSSYGMWRKVEPLSSKTSYMDAWFAHLSAHPGSCTDLVDVARWVDPLCEHARFLDNL